MAEIDPVILELRADLAKYRSEVRQQAADTERQLGRSEKAVQRLEKQFLKSSTAISGSFRTLGATLGTVFTGRELVGLLDSFTRMQNSLRTTGLEGERLKATQDRLFATAQKYGVELEGLAQLYSTTSQAAQGFGASQSDVFRVTNGVSAALKLTGQTSQQAAGALLQLGQAFRSPKVQAEEFNSLIDGLYPLLEAAAQGSERWGGSVNKLIADVKAGKVAGQEFFNAVAAGSAVLEGRATNATLTLAGGYTTLTNALTVYFGEADKANGVSAALGYVFEQLAANLDTLIPALAVIATALGVGFVTNAVRARIAVLALAQANGTLAASSLVAGRAMLAAFGGPVGIAITALVVGIGYLVTATDEAAEAARQAEIQSLRTNAALKAETEATDALSHAKGREREAMLSSMQASRARALQAIQTAQALRLEASAALALAKFQAAAEAKDNAGGFGAKIAPLPGKKGASIQRTEAAIRVADDRIARLQGIYDGIGKAIETAGKPVSLPAIGDDGKSKKGRKGPSGPSVAEIEIRFNQELASLAQQALSARQQLATSAEDRAELEMRSVELARVSALESLKADKDYSKAQKARVADAIENLAEIERERIQREKRIQQFEEATDAAEQQNRYAQDALQRQFDLATTDDERRRIALLILDAEDAFLRSKLESIAANEDLNDAIRAQAQRELDALNASSGERKAVVEKANQGALGRYIDSIGDTRARVEEATVRKLQAVNDGITDALAEKLGVKDQFVKSLFSIFLDEVIFKPLAEALRDGQSAGGGLFGSLLGGIFGSLTSNKGGVAAGIPRTGGSFGLGLPGRASGGPVEAGRLYRINEAGIEGFVPANSGTIIPAGQMNAIAARAGTQAQGIAKVQIELSGDIDGRIAAISGPIAVEVVKVSAKPLIDAAANETTRRLTRPKL